MTDDERNALDLACKRARSDGYIEGVSESFDLVLEHVENMCTWSTRDSRMQVSLINWLKANGAKRPSSPDRSKE